jgi:peptide methionine sulfoxide reductase MsrB
MEMIDLPEMRRARCGEHPGHVFPAGPGPDGLLRGINPVAPAFGESAPIQAK